MRGADPFAGVSALDDKGRSPRARGRRCRRDWEAAMSGSIPACAGQKYHPPYQTRRERVDPRVRGADRPRSWPSTLTSGRSPRARGRLLHARGAEVRAGSIPACAGQTGRHQRDLTVIRVDPRVRGADCSILVAGLMPWGRSPRARGRPQIPAGRRRPSGSIPACAGQTARSQGSLEPCRVDPRVRGADRCSRSPLPAG